MSGQTRRLVPTPARVRGAVAFLLLFLVVVGGAMSLGSVSTSEPSAVDGLPHSSQAWVANQVQQTLPHALAQPALIVFDRADHSVLSASELTRLRSLAPQLVSTVSDTAPRSRAAALGGLVVSPRHDVALLTLSIPSAPSDTAVSDRVLALRHELDRLRPSGVRSYVTGAPAFTTDLGQVFNGANTTLLLTTVLVVALLLIATYRSPLLWLIPLLVVGMADQVSGQLAGHLAPHLGIRLDGGATGIAEVLVFGAGTDYALLLIARYRDQLRREADRFAAMRVAVARTAEAVLASGTTVAISLALLLLASMASTRALGFAGGLGIVIAMAFVLLVLPAALLVCGRGIFWPLVPRVGETNHGDGRVFSRVGAFVQRRTKTVALASILLLVVVATLGVGLRQGLSTTQQFTATPESVVGQQVLASAFPAGASDPAFIMTRTDTVAATLAAARRVPGVSAVSPGVHDGTWSELDATLSAAPGTAASFAEVDALRSAVASVADSSAVVGGDVAVSLDASRAANHDTGLLVPLILLVVVAVLIALLRSLTAPLLLLATVALSYFAALGISWAIFQHVTHYPALGTGTPFYAFLFLVALGVDYNIFLTSRAREESFVRGSAAGMLEALRSTGGVITSAGVLLASVFAVLGVLPLIQLTQIGIIVCVGVLLDTLLVRTVLVPALALWTGDRFWWPSRRGPNSTGD